MKLLKYLNAAGESVQTLFFLFLIFVASIVAYFQGYNPVTPKDERTAKQHFFEYSKTFLSGTLAFFFTLLISDSQKWDFPWTCLVGGVSVLFSKQFFEMLFNTVVVRIFGGVNPTTKPLDVPMQPVQPTTSNNKEGTDTIK